MRSSPSRWRQSKKNGRSPRRRRWLVLAAEPAITSWKRWGSSSSAGRADDLAVEHGRRRAAGARTRSTTSGQPGGHVVEVAGVEADLVADPVDLEAHAVELPLHRGAARPPPPSGLGHRSARWTPASADSGRSTSRPIRSRPAAPSVRATWATWPRSPDSSTARRTQPGGDAAARATAAATTPARAPWRSSPVKRRRRNSASAAGRPAEQAAAGRRRGRWPNRRRSWPAAGRWRRRPRRRSATAGRVLGRRGGRPWPSRRRRAPGGAARRGGRRAPRPGRGRCRRRPWPSGRRRSRPGAAGRRAGRSWSSAPDVAVTAADVATTSARSIARVWPGWRLRPAPRHPDRREAVARREIWARTAGDLWTSKGARHGRRGRKDRRREQRHGRAGARRGRRWSGRGGPRRGPRLAGGELGPGADGAGLVGARRRRRAGCSRPGRRASAVGACPSATAAGWRPRSWPPARSVRRWVWAR